MTQDDHVRRVASVQGAVRRVAKSGKQAKIYHGSTNSTRPILATGLQPVDVSALSNILEINTAKQYAIVEPNVPLDALVKATTAQGLVPPVIAEFPGITAGGAVQGGSGESSSFKWGSFHETCLEYDVILGDGSLLTVSPTKHADLFDGMSCAFGSLGIITRIKIKLVPATTYVRLTYYPTSGFDEAVRSVQQQCKSAVDFVDGILFSKNSGVVMAGTYTNTRGDLPIARFSRATDDWFCVHAQRICNKNQTYEEVIPLTDYLFRYDRGAFWMAKYGFPKPFFNRLTRTIFSGIISTRMLYKFLHASRYAFVYLIQDICLPERSVVKFLQFAHKNYDIYPLWLCPLRPTTKDKLSPSALDTDLVINVGIWGDMKPSNLDFTERNREVERQAQQLGGRKVLYAHSYYTPEEFWKVYDRQGYDTLRKKYKAGAAFANLYQKVHTEPTTIKPSKMRGGKALFGLAYKSR